MLPTASPVVTSFLGRTIVTYDFEGKLSFFGLGDNGELCSIPCLNSPPVLGYCCPNKLESADGSLHILRVVDHDTCQVLSLSFVALKSYIEACIRDKQYVTARRMIDTLPEESSRQALVQLLVKQEFDEVLTFLLSVFLLHPAVFHSY
jgi:uncharacterized membrane protein